MTENDPIIITSALPYANGSLHIGHVLEFIQTDILVRYFRLKGRKVTYCCATDSHGTPIEIKATQLGIKPAQMVEDYWKEFQTDLNDYGVKFDSWYTTNSDENRHFAELIFKRLKDKNLIVEKEMELSYCESCKRFLPDRYVKGGCPKCGAYDQYGDNCEKCNATYETTDLVEPYCTICKKPSTRKNSTHLFFKLTEYSDFLEKWLTNNPRLQPEIKKQILNWIKEGLNDWCISRDAPYFGFEIPGHPGKYFYVWLDAPIGYISSLANYHGKDTEKAIEDWNNSEVLHVIGKDIIYFHWLFWPAMLHAADFKVPENILVHGFITVNKEKMSKSRGTFLTARDFLDMSEPEFLRFYYGANLTRSMTDIDLDLGDFQERINTELVSNIANLVYRSLSFINKNFDSKLSKINDSDKEVLKKSKDLVAKCIENYENYSLREAVKNILAIGHEGNRFFQDKEPWFKVKEDPAAAQETLTLCANLVKDIVILLKPIMPEFAKNIEQQLNLNDLTLADINITLEDHTIGKAEIIYKKIEKVALPKLAELSAKELEHEPKKESNIVEDIEIHIAKILKVEDHPDAEKLYVIEVDIKKEKRQLVAGLKAYYKPEELLGKKVCMVTNLEHAKLRGVESQGMLLAADDGNKVLVLEPKSSDVGDRVYFGELPEDKPPSKLNFKRFAKAKITVESKKIVLKGKALRTDKEDIEVDLPNGSQVR